MNTHWSDEVRRTLKHLGSMHPPPGFEDRILRRLDLRRATSAKSSAYRLSPYTWGLLTGGTATLLLLGALSWHLRHSKTLGSAHNLKSHPVVERVASATPEDRISPAHPSPVPTRHGIRAAFARAERESAAELASFPAPEAPLTDQERLLLRLARKPNQGTMAMFDPRISQERAALEAAEFTDFFKPPPEPVQPTDLKEEKNERNPSTR